MRRAAALIVCVVGISTALAACSVKNNPGSPAKTKTQNSQGGTSAKQEGTVPQGSIPVNTTTTLPKAGATLGATCTYGQLAITQVSSGVYKTSDVGVFGISNVSKTRCSLTGFPTMVVFGRLGPFQGQVTQGNVAGVGTLGQGAVTLSPDGGQASFAVSWTPVSTTESCPDGTGVIITLPGITKGYTVSTILNACGGMLNVSPVQPNVIVSK
jgi:hypothetical protein